MKPFIPNRFEAVTYNLLISGLMSFIMSAAVTFMNVGLIGDFIWIWLRAWLTAWALAFLAVIFVSPIARGLVARLVVGSDAPPKSKDE